MTTTTDNEKDDLWSFFDALGVTHLERFLAEGADFEAEGLTLDDIEAYARTAATIAYGPEVETSMEGISGREYMQCFYLDLVSRLMANDDASGVEFRDDGTAWIDMRSEPPEMVEITERSARHWQWMFLLFSGYAERFLDVVPAVIRDEAIANAKSKAKAEEAAFWEMAVRLKRDKS